MNLNQNEATESDRQVKCDLIEISTYKWAEEQSKNDQLLLLKLQLETNKKITVEDYALFHKQYKIEDDGTLTRSGRILILVHFRKEICNICHDNITSGHFGQRGAVDCFTNLELLKKYEVLMRLLCPSLYSTS